MQKTSLLRPVVVLVLVMLCSHGATLHAVPWKPITPEDLAATARIDPEAGIEIMLREVTIDDEDPTSTAYHNYIRLKVFNERGLREIDKVELFGIRDFFVDAVSARVVKPDGTIVPVDRKAIYKRDTIRRGSLKVRVTAFTFPALEPGCLVEYQWKHVATEDSGGVRGLTLHFQEKFPTWLVRFRLRPYPDIPPEYVLKSLHFRYSQPLPKPDKQNYFNFELKDVPAIKEEPRMPPDDAVQSWLHFYYVKAGQSPQEFWTEWGKAVAGYVDKRIRPDKAIAAMAGTLGEGAPDEMARLQRYYDFCRSRITDVNSDTSGLTPEERAKLRENKSAAQVLERGAGTDLDINLLFLSLASAGGFPARMACVGDRSERFPEVKVAARMMFPDWVPAVKVGDAWRFFDPGKRYLPFDSVLWQNERVSALICDAKNSEFVVTPGTPVDRTKVVRRAALQLDEEGTLSGAVTMQFSGHEEARRKREFDGETVEGAGKIVREWVHARLGTAEISNVVVTNADKPLEPIKITYDIRVPEYADRTGSRLVFVPSFFEKGGDPEFTSETREFDVYFPYSFVEEDVVEIKLPPGFALEQAAAPASMDSSPVMRYKVVLAVTKSGGKVIYKRMYSVDGMVFPKDVYTTVKQFHDAMHARDQHALVLKRVEDAPATAPAAAAP